MNWPLQLTRSLLTPLRYVPAAKVTAALASQIERGHPRHTCPVCGGFRYWLKRGTGWWLCGFCREDVNGLAMEWTALQKEVRDGGVAAAA